ncbi:hypothetical protein KSP40_PGU009138 [Platanthera guangdongensis]|uniref:Uncharacterized protein n=1 Tax=Platanthera guangdongensis TaxID=2320717 RepID=A0ABR2LCC2_9ASPA
MESRFEEPLPELFYVSHSLPAFISLKIAFLFLPDPVSLPDPAALLLLLSNSDIAIAEIDDEPMAVDGAPGPPLPSEEHVTSPPPLPHSSSPSTSIEYIPDPTISHAEGFGRKSVASTSEDRVKGPWSPEE